VLATSRASSKGRIVALSRPRFLRHLSRTMLLVHLLDVSGLTGRDRWTTSNAIIATRGLRRDAGDQAADVVANKLDLVEARDRYPELKARFARGVSSCGPCRRPPAMAWRRRARGGRAGRLRRGIDATGGSGGHPLLTKEGSGESRGEVNR